MEDELSLDLDIYEDLLEDDASSKPDAEELEALCKGAQNEIVELKLSLKVLEEKYEKVVRERDTLKINFIKFQKFSKKELFNRSNQIGTLEEKLAKFLDCRPSAALNNDRQMASVGTQYMMKDITLRVADGVIGGKKAGAVLPDKDQPRASLRKGSESDVSAGTLACRDFKPRSLRDGRCRSRSPTSGLAVRRTSLDNRKGWRPDRDSPISQDLITGASRSRSPKRNDLRNPIKRRGIADSGVFNARQDSDRVKERLRISRERKRRGENWRKSRGSRLTLHSEQSENREKSTERKNSAKNLSGKGAESVPVPVSVNAEDKPGSEGASRGEVEKRVDTDFGNTENPLSADAVKKPEGSSECYREVGEDGAEPGNAGNAFDDAVAVAEEEEKEEGEVFDDPDDPETDLVVLRELVKVRERIKQRLLESDDTSNTFPDGPVGKDRRLERMSSRERKQARFGRERVVSPTGRGQGPRSGDRKLRTMGDRSARNNRRRSPERTARRVEDESGEQHRKRHGSSPQGQRNKRLKSDSKSPSHRKEDSQKRSTFSKTVPEFKLVDKKSSRAPSRTNNQQQADATKGSSPSHSEPLETKVNPATCVVSTANSGLSAPSTCWGGWHMQNSQADEMADNDVGIGAKDEGLDSVADAMADAFECEQDGEIILTFDDHFSLTDSYTDSTSQTADSTSESLPAATIQSVCTLGFPPTSEADAKVAGSLPNLVTQSTEHASGIEPSLETAATQVAGWLPTPVTEPADGILEFEPAWEEAAQAAGSLPTPATQALDHALGFPATWTQAADSLPTKEQTPFTNHSSVTQTLFHFNDHESQSKNRDCQKVTQTHPVTERQPETCVTRVLEATDRTSKTGDKICGEIEIGIGIGHIASTQDCNGNLAAKKVKSFCVRAMNTTSTKTRLTEVKLNLPDSLEHTVKSISKTLRQDALRLASCACATRPASLRKRTRARNVFSVLPHADANLAEEVPQPKVVEKKDESPTFMTLFTRRSLARQKKESETQSSDEAQAVTATDSSLVDSNKVRVDSVH